MKPGDGNILVSREWRNNVRYLVTAVLAVLLLTGCDAVQDMRTMWEKQEIVSKMIRERYGWDTGVGWHMQNGRLTEVTVIFAAGDVGREQVATLEQAAREAVTKAFRSSPQVIRIQVECRP